MNIFQLLSDIEKVDPEVYDRLDSRRSIFKHISGMSKNLATTAAVAPLAFGAMLNKAYAQAGSGAPGVNDVLNFALRLEYLEAEFYDQGLGKTGATGATAVQTALRAGFSATNLAALDLIRTDEAKHVAFLRGVLGTNAIAAPAANTFDFTGGKGSAGGPFATVFTSADTFLAVSQALEDTGVRAYKGGAPYLASNDVALTAALNIHSVEARHASRIRTMRRAGATNNMASGTAAAGTAISDRSASPKSWISGNDNGGPVPAQTAAVYAEGIAPSYTPSNINFPGEENIIQAGVTLSSLPNVSGFPPVAFSEAFDEPLPVPTVIAIASTFVVKDNTFFG